MNISPPVYNILRINYVKSRFDPLFFVKSRFDPLFFYFLLFIFPIFAGYRHPASRQVLISTFANNQQAHEYMLLDYLYG